MTIARYSDASVDHIRSFYRRERKGILWSIQKRIEQYGEDTLSMIRFQRSLDLDHILCNLMRDEMNKTLKDHCGFDHYFRRIEICTMDKIIERLDDIFSWYFKVMNKRTLKLIEHKLPMYVEDIVLEYL